MDSFIQLLNNRARCVAKGCSELVKIFLTITICGWSKAKKISNNKIIFPYIYFLDIVEVNYFYRHS